MMKQTTNRRSALKAAYIICLVLFMFFYPVSIEFRQLPGNIPMEGSFTSSQETFLSSAAGTIFQFMEIAREARGTVSTDVSKNEIRGSRLAVQLSFLFLLVALYSSPRVIFPSREHCFFPFQNNFIHSRRIILRFIERQDGSKIH